MRAAGGVRHLRSACRRASRRRRRRSRAPRRRRRQAPAPRNTAPRVRSAVLRRDDDADHAALVPSVSAFISLVAARGKPLRRIASAEIRQPPRADGLDGAAAGVFLFCSSVALWLSSWLVAATALLAPAWTNDRASTAPASSGPASTSSRRRGRGAVSNASGRFEPRGARRDRRRLGFARGVAAVRTPR